MSWLDESDNEYKEKNPKWTYAGHHLTGDVLDKLGTYLPQKGQGESDGAYDFRKQIADYTPHYMRAAVTLAGMLFAVEHDAQRTWTKEDQDGLGDPNEDRTTMSQIWGNADGDENNWPSVLSRAAVRLITQRKIYGLVDGIKRDEQGQEIAPASVHIIDPTKVPDKIKERGRLIAVKVESKADDRDSLMDKQDLIQEWWVYRSDALYVYRKNKDGDAVIARQAPYFQDGRSFYQTERRRREILPVFSVEVPVESEVGYLMAKKANSIFNLENLTDFNLMASAIHRFLADVQDTNGNLAPELYDELKESLKDGDDVLPGSGHKYVGPPMAGAETRIKRIEQKTEAFFTSFFQSYGDSARERTATEIRQDFRQGVEAYLTLLSRALDEFENGLLKRLEQVYFPDNVAAWGGAHVKRSRDFSAVDIEGRVDKLKERYVGNGAVPVSVDQAMHVLSEMYEADGLPVPEDDELKTLAQFVVTQQSQGTTRGQAMMNGGGGL